VSYGSGYLGPEGNQYFGGQRVYAHGLVPLRPEPRADTAQVEVTLRRGVTVRGRLVRPDGKPVTRASMLHRLQVSPWDHVVGGSVDVHDGGFQLRGCDPEATYRVHFLDAANQLGAAVEISGKQAGDESVMVRLLPCGTASARLVDPHGQPIRKTPVWIDLIVTPGPLGFDVRGPAADAVWFALPDGAHSLNDVRTDAEGRLVLPRLIPGATYRFHVAGGEKAPGVTAKDFTVQPGQRVDWGDIVGPVLPFLYSREADSVPPE
jgi:hypothetical protein